VEEARLVEFQLQSLVIFLPSTPCSERKEEKHTHKVFQKVIGQRTGCYGICVCVCVFGALRERERTRK
jgi:hypothetical protein